MVRAGVLLDGKYRVLKKLGEGAMGSVWLAKNEVTDREFAVKMLLPESASAPAALARFFQEARVCGALRHPSILEVYDAGTAAELDGAPYLVMERLDGATLDTLIEQRGALDPRLALDVIAEISRGLHLAHVKGVIHRDLKPANVFLHRPGTGAVVPKVLDFGISKMIDRAGPAIALTQSSTVLGSPMYMSPEQMDPGKALDARSDIHALGVLLWECLTGTAPFASTSYNNLVVEIVRGPRPRLKDAMPGATDGMAAIVERAFAIEVADRPASAAELADALEAELASIGGGVLLSRSAAVDVLGRLDLNTKPPPAPQASTFKPLSVDRNSTGDAAATLLASDASPVSMAATEVAPVSAAALGVSAAARSGARGTRGGRRRVLLVGGAAAVALVVAVLAAGRHRPGPPAAASVGVPPTPESTTVLASAPPPAPVKAPFTVAPGSSAPAPLPQTSAPPRAAATAPPARKAAAAVPPAPPVARPRIDQSGL